MDEAPADVSSKYGYWVESREYTRARLHMHTAFTCAHTTRTYPHAPAHTFVEVY